jgi:hypothetical protein
MPLFFVPVSYDAFPRPVCIPFTPVLVIPIHQCDLAQTPWLCKSLQLFGH